MIPNIRVLISPSSGLTEIGTHTERIEDEEYLSHDGSLLLKLQLDSALHFGPCYYKAAIYGRDGRLILDFKERRFFSCAIYRQSLSTLGSPWSATSLRLALPELLSKMRSNPQGTKVARMNILDFSQQTPGGAWNSESITTHIMWGRDGQLYLYRDAFRIYAIAADRMELTVISQSRSDHCFVLENRFVCVIEKQGEISIVDGISGKLLVTEDISRDRYSVRRAVFVEEQNCVLVLMKREYGGDEEGLCYSVRLQF